MITAAKTMCYLALAIFLIFNVEMAPFLGKQQGVAYAVMAIIAVLLVVAFNKIVIPIRSKVGVTVSLIVSAFVIVACLGVRIVYETKIDRAKVTYPDSGRIYIIANTKTVYYNETGTGTIRNPSSYARIGDETEDIYCVILDHEYALRVGAGGQGTGGESSGGYVDSTVIFTENSFENGKYEILKRIYFKSGPATMADVTVTFSRVCPFWDVVLNRQ